MDQAARREAFEETGAELGKVWLMGAYTSFKDWKTDHNLVFVCEISRSRANPIVRSPKSNPSLWMHCPQGCGRDMCADSKNIKWDRRTRNLESGEMEWKLLWEIFILFTRVALFSWGGGPGIAGVDAA
ncbi:MAG: hypothetical protein IPI86_06210 [Anaerolineales bacterium]|nr:hypothetical protein [Anaerolineales bacterium]